MNVPGLRRSAGANGRRVYALSRTDFSEGLPVSSGFFDETNVKIQFVLSENESGFR